MAAFVAYRTKAIILAGSRRQQTDHLLARELGRYITNGGRVVTLGKSTIPGAEFLEVGNWQGARQLAAALIGRGITRFAILSGPPDLNTARDRVAGYQEALSAASLSPLAVVNGDFNSQGGHTSALRCWKTVGRTHPERQGSQPGPEDR